MSSLANSPLSIAIASDAHLLKGASDDYDPLLELIGDARFVFLGTAAHGAQEFCRERASITRRLIAEKDFDAVAVEADWPAACRVNRHVRRLDDNDDGDALAGFERFPSWMWRNADIVRFVGWLRARNDAYDTQARKAGFYGLDLYSLFASIAEVQRYLDGVDPDAARRARARYACFERFREDSQHYGYAAGFRLSKTCERQVDEQLAELRGRAAAYCGNDDELAADEFFSAERNALAVRDAERYYRAMFDSPAQAWNLRARHMADTLDALATRLSRPDRPAKLVVWGHNVHIGDARAARFGRQGEWSLGRLARERYGGQAVLIGFTAYHGTVTAASEWGAPAARLRLRPALEGSHEASLHHTGMSNFMLPLRQNEAAQALSNGMLERAIGIIYLPDIERRSHYLHAVLPRQFDAILHFDETHAVEPLERNAKWETGEAPPTYPVGV